MKRMLTYTMALLLLGLLFSCSGGDDKYLAKVNGQTITEEDFSRGLGALPAQVRARFMVQNGVDDFLDELVNKEILYQEGKKRGFHNNKEVKERVLDSKKFFIVEYLLRDEVGSKAKVSDRDVQNFYEENLEAMFTQVDEGGGKTVIPLDNIRDLIINRLAVMKEREIFKAYLADLKKKYKVELNAAELKRLKAMGPAETDLRIMPPKNVTPGPGAAAPSALHSAPTAPSVKPPAATGPKGQ